MTFVSSRHPSVVSFGLGLILPACAGGPAVSPPPLAGPPAVLAEIRVEDAGGPLGGSGSRAALRALQREDPSGLLKHHLAEVERVMATPLVVGNDARLQIDGPQTEAAMFREIARARDHIDLETYILEAAGAGERLAGLLEERLGAGVRVRILYDGVGSLTTPKAYFERLRGAGAAVCEFNPVNPLRLDKDPRLTVNNRDHRKLLVVDRRVGFTGGINISTVYSSGSFGRKPSPPNPHAGWRDTHVLVRGPVVAQFQQLFDQAWRSQGCAPPEAAAARPMAAPAQAGDMAMRLAAADPLTERSELYPALLSAMDQARQRIWLTYGYFVPDEGVLRALLEAARRGVDVRLVLPGFSDFWAPFHAGRSHYTDLLAAGVRIFERRDALLHAKTAVIDGVWSSVGSTNLDWRSFVHNYEADLLVLDRGFATQLEGLFALDQAASHEVRLPEWRRRDLGKRVLEWLARRWEYLL